MKCPHCDHNIADNETVCPFCQQPIFHGYGFKARIPSGWEPFITPILPDPEPEKPSSKFEKNSINQPGKEPIKVKTGTKKSKKNAAFFLAVLILGGAAVYAVHSGSDRHAPVEPVNPDISSQADTSGDPEKSTPDNKDTGISLTPADLQQSMINRKCRNISDKVNEHAYEPLPVGEDKVFHLDDQGSPVYLECINQPGFYPHQKYYYESSSCIMAEYFGEDTERFYFKDAKLIRWLHFKNGNTDQKPVVEDPESHEFKLWEEDLLKQLDTWNQEYETEISNRTEEDGTEYLLPNSDTEYISRTQIEGMTQEELRLARNEIYARHGRQFDNPELQSYFNDKSWYTGSISPDLFDTNVLSDCELANLDTIILYEKEQGYRK